MGDLGAESELARPADSSRPPRRIPSASDAPRRGAATLAGNVFHRVRGIGDQDRQVGPLLPPAVDRRLFGVPRRLFSQQLQRHRRHFFAGVFRSRRPICQRQHVDPALQEGGVEAVLLCNVLGREFAISCGFRGRSEILGAVGEDRGVIDLIKRSELGVILQQQDRLVDALEARPMPDDVAGLVRPTDLGCTQVQHDIALTGRRLEIEFERLCLHRSGIVRNLADRVAIDVAADCHEFPQRSPARRRSRPSERERPSRMSCASGPNAV